MKRRFKFRKARRNGCREEADSEITNLVSTSENHETCINKVKKVSRNHVPKSCRTEFIPVFALELTQYMHTHTELKERDPFRYETTNKR